MAAWGSRAAARRARAMLAAPARRSAVVTTLRTAGALPVRARWVGAGGFDAQVGDAVYDFFAGALAVQGAGVSDDAKDLGGAGEVDAGRGRDLQDALLGAAVAA